ncbi:1-phosphofructokinase family hexose kinase [Micromonospora cathayae]|uniref:PfkB family carbohydrate kinase n=1 Tax=Micromonospora cathayae TaxID=3028804 RepID=A0ABY7ZL03_9ACTN|nr:PfkB family carbohydrate kinase [Micromonospora sp. HUAS 3]WDZ83620.1 PfkB family carbohydrate kinase [Micromonospora sp. HUAS 3]
MDERVMVFAPAPLLTVTIEQQADTLELHLHPGGQGVWQSRMITCLGTPVTLCVALGGEVGAALGKLLVDEDVTLRVVNGGSTTGWYVHDRRDGSRAEVAENPGTPMARHDIDELYTVTLTEGLRAPVSVLSGPADPDVVDPDIYRRLAADLTANGGTVVADLSGAHLAAVLDGGIAVLKVSHEELIDDGLADDDSVGALLAAGRALRERGAASVLISRAGEPALALLDDQPPMLVHAPPLELADHRGAGDSMTAGVAAVLARGGDLTEAVRTGAAAGALNVTRHGLGTGRAEAVRELAGRVRLTPLDEGTAGKQTGNEKTEDGRTGDDGGR